VYLMNTRFQFMDTDRRLWPYTQRTGWWVSMISATDVHKARACISQRDNRITDASCVAQYPSRNLQLLGHASSTQVQGN
jgi:hypothetical protein